MMAPKFSPIVAMLLLAGTEVAAPNGARAEAAKAATLDPLGVAPMHVRCFMARTSAEPLPSREYASLHYGWLCLPEVRPTITH